MVDLPVSGSKSIGFVMYNALSEVMQREIVLTMIVCAYQIARENVRAKIC